MRLSLEARSPDLTKVDTKLDYWSQQLYDLSGRNRLLYYREPKSSAITIEQPEFLPLFEALVERGAELQVPLPAPGEADFSFDATQIGEEDAGLAEAVDLDAIVALDADQVVLEAEGPPTVVDEGGQSVQAGTQQNKSKSTRKAKKNEIQANRSVVALNRVMYNLRYLSRTVQEEQGFNILYATLGMLKWREAHDHGFSHAPLILVPIQIDRDNPNSAYRIRMAEEDIVVNPVLQVKLAKDFGFQLPEVPNDLSTEQLKEFLLETSERISRFAGWEVLERATLGVFNFLTLLLVKDFEKNMASYREHPIVRSLCGVEDPIISMLPSVPQARELDDQVDPSNVFQVLDADSSQQEAIEAAKRGMSFILQGPPGTGKSQTIANIIVESMMAGKKVLFVSQKMAALEVVRDRLNRRGLGEFCLEIHSHKMDKSKVLHDLMDSLASTPLPVANPNYRAQQRELKHIRDELNNYVRQLHEPRFGLGLSLYQAQGRLAHVLDAPTLNFSVPNLEEMSIEQLSEMLSLLRELASYRSIVENYGRNRWKGYRGPSNSLEEREALAARFQDVRTAISGLYAKIGEIAAEYHLPNPETFQDCFDYVEVFSAFRPAIFSRSLQESVDRYLERDGEVLRLFRSKPGDDLAKIRAVSRKGILLSEKRIAQALAAVRKIAARRPLVLFESSSNYEPAEAEFNSLQKDREQILIGFELARSLFDEDEMPALLGKGLALTPSEADQWFLECGSHIGELAEWANFNLVRKECDEIGLQDFVTRALEAKLPVEQLEVAFARRFYLLLTERIIASRPVLQKFRGATQSEMVRRFRELDLAIIGNSSHEIRTRLHKNKPEWSWMEAGSAETSILRRESNKKRRIRPLRKLFVEIPNLIRALKPCLMMSPFTVCQLLDPAVYQFDVAVFDEASQIPPEYAMCAFVRARQVIVAGDSQQLPPTNFFQNLETEDVESEDDVDNVSFESILDICDSSGFPNKMLNWHYRSKDESLIAYSNYHFYDNHLFTFPNPSYDNPTTGLKFVYVPDGIYKSGMGARYNHQEAKRVAELVHAHLVQTPELSLGIVTFSAPQRRMIEAEIENLRKEHPELNDLFSYDSQEAIFIKNLENVQGDERDSIILSVGYGRDGNGKMALNFGPINRPGGARRLNVAVTRARYLLQLVASIQPEDIDLRRASSQGAMLLKKYLEAARDGVRAVIRAEQHQAEFQFRTLFEESVFNALSGRGLQLVPNVGISQYRIDLAVVDPEQPGRYLLGIECDGPMYFSASTARDRERLRQQVLEGLGWRIHRVWSRDWIRDREAEIEKIIQAVEASGLEAGVLETLPGRNQLETGAGPSPRTLVEAEEVSEPRGPLAAVPYQKTQLGTQFTAHGDSILEAPLSDVIDAFQAIAVAEGPISIKVAKSLVLDAWKTRRGKKIDERLDSALLRGQEQKAFGLNGSFIWPVGLTVAPLRVHQPGQPLRPIKDIAPEEMQVAVRECVKGAVTISPGDLAREVCRLFGLKATQENQSVVETVINSMIQNGELDLEKDRVSKGRKF